MIVKINGRFLSRRPTGVDRFAKEVIAGIGRLAMAGDPLARDCKFELVVPQGTTIPEEFQGLHVRYVGEGSGQKWEQFDLVRAVKGGGVLLSLCNTAPAFRRNQVVVIHDAATVSVPAAFSFGFRTWYRLLMPVLGRVASKVLTVSKFSQSEIVDKFGISSSKVGVVVEGGEHIVRVAPDDSVLERFDLRKRPFVLAVSSMAAHKNFGLVLDALQKLENPPFDVAIAGGANARVFGEKGKLKSDRVRWLGYVSDGELRSLYEHAMCFVFPSVYEGFGIPPLEAMQCGCPVLASKAASIPEVCGDAAEYFDPRDAEGLAAKLMQVCGDSELRRVMIEKGRLQAARFSWEEAARQVLSACVKVVR